MDNHLQVLQQLSQFEEPPLSSRHQKEIGNPTQTSQEQQGLKQRQAPSRNMDFDVVTMLAGLNRPHSILPGQDAVHAGDDMFLIKVHL